jgi:mannosylglycerate hydrolase
LKPFTALLVSHTHWDRAWYLPFQVYRLRLVRLMDRLLDILERDPDFHSFMLDGQMLPVEDYLEIRPERRAGLERLVRAGRLFLGPWYALADEYLVSPEALIRNLLLGTRLAQEMGGVMREGYVPDAFGHIRQLPQILQGFGISSALFMRGVGDEGENLGDEFWWEAPDGSQVLAIHLRNTYSNAVNLGYPMRWNDPSAMEFDMELALRRLREAVDLLKTHTHGHTLLLLNGTDHTEADPNVPNVIARANETFADVQIEHGSLPDYVARLQAAGGDDLPSFQGEFNRGRYTYSLQGVYSSRMYLQQANERAQTLLECYAEPLGAWAWLLGEPYPAAFLRLAWRRLLQNHPHDDICGCSVDAVHREDVQRFDEVEQIGETLARNSCRTIMRRIDRTAQPGVPFVIFNPTAWPRSETVEVDLCFEQDDETAQDFHLVTASGQAIPTQRLSQTAIVEMEVGKPETTPRVRLALAATALPPCGYRVYYALPGQPVEPPAIEHPVEAFPDGMENRHLRLEIQADGTLNVLDKRTGRQFHDLSTFCDDEDAGDEYDYAPCPNPERICTLGKSAAIRLLQAGPLRATYEIAHELELPISLAEDRQRRSAERITCPITTLVTLHHNSGRVDVQTTVDNRARDHRLRVCFPSGIRTDVSAADGHFDVLTRPIDLPAGEGWAQPPVSTKHQRTFVDLSDGQAGLAIFNRGLPEYEVLRDDGRNTIAVTLLRCVGHLSRGDMLSRPGHAGLPLTTPEAQCQGMHTFEYAIVPHSGDWRDIYRQAYAFRAPVLVRRGTEREGFVPSAAHLQKWGVDEIKMKPLDLSGDLPSVLSFLTLEPDTLCLSAVKQSEGGDGLIVRFYNPTDEPEQATVHVFQPIRAAYEVNLNEGPQRTLAVQAERRVDLAIGGKQVKTIELYFVGHQKNPEPRTTE